MSSSSSSGSTLSGLRLSGTSLMSGLDTESIVKQMASATKNKINKQQQKADSLTWKQTSYRAVSTKISTFRDTYFNSLTPATNISSNSLMGATKATSSNSTVIATAAAGAAATTYSITDIEQLAKNAEIDSNFGTGTLSSGIKLDFSNAVSGTTYNLKMSLDGTSRDVSFTAGTNATTSSSNFLNAVKSAFGTEGTKFSIPSGSLVYTPASGDTIVHTFDIAASGKDTTPELQTASLKSVGLPEGGSNKLSLNSKLSDVNFTNALTGGSYSFSINGTAFTFDSSSTVKDIISEINSSTSANVTMSFNNLSQKFSIKSDNEGAASAVRLSQTNGNLLTSLFGSSVISKGKQLGSTILMDDEVAGTALEYTDFTDNKNTKMEVTLNGVTKSIGLWGYDSNGDKYDYTNTSSTVNNVTTITTGAAKAAASLNAELTRAFGTSAPSFKYDEASKKLILDAKSSGDVITVGAVKDDSASSTLLNKLGFGSSVTKTNAVTTDTKLSALMGSNFSAGSITIGTKTLSINSSTTLGAIESAFGTNVSVDYTKGVISAKGKISSTEGSGQSLIAKLFNDAYTDINTYSSTMSSSSGTADAVYGKNAIVTVNGAKITNATNNLTFDGTSINIGNLTTTQADAVTDAAPITISTARDNTNAKAAVIKFIDSYNKLVDELYTELETKRPTSDGTVNGTKFDPLTEEQRKEMSDDEIKNWEEKAKTGLLYNDSKVADVISRLRTAMSTTTSSGYSLYKMGVTGSSLTSDHGKLTISEASLNTAFEESPDEIQELFTNSTNGLAAAMTFAIDSAVSTSRSSGYGSLVRVAGIASTASASTNEIATQITTYQKTIKSLKTKYSDEMERYWSKFTALETASAKYSQYSSLFTSST